MLGLTKQCENKVMKTCGLFVIRHKKASYDDSLSTEYILIEIYVQKD
jgi:hypothetical protein